MDKYPCLDLDFILANHNLPGMKTSSSTSYTTTVPLSNIIVKKMVIDMYQIQKRGKEMIIGTSLFIRLLLVEISCFNFANNLRCNQTIVGEF